LPCTAQPRPKGEMPNESFSADRCRRSLRIGDNTHATGRGDADVAAGTRRCANRRRYRSGTRRPRPWSRAYGARRSWPSLRLGRRTRASLWLVTRQTSRLELNPISPFAVVALVATTAWRKSRGARTFRTTFGRRSASSSTAAGSRDATPQPRRRSRARCRTPFRIPGRRGSDEATRFGCRRTAGRHR
jgi:hypothetical protein